MQNRKSGKVEVLICKIINLHQVFQKNFFSMHYVDFY